MFFDHTASLGGGEIALLHLVQHMNRDRFTPFVVLSSDGALRAKLEESGVETHILPLSSSVLETRKDSLGGRSLLRLSSVLQTLGYVGRLVRFIKRHRADVLHTNSLKSDIIGGVAGHLARVPVIWHVRDRITDDYLPRPVVHLFRWLCRVLPDYIITNSSSTLSTLCLPAKGNRRSRMNFKGVGKAVSVVHDGVVATKVQNNRQASEAPTIGLVGRITQWKGQHIFIDAAAIVRREFPDARFQIIGSAMFGEMEYEAQIRSQVESLGLSDCVEFTGFRSDVPQMIQKLDILVHASTTGEPFGQVIIEGMIAAKPVVATDGGGVPEIVQDGVSGVLVPMSEVEPMAEAILWLLRDPRRAIAMGEAGYQRVQQHFTINHTARKVEVVYDEIASTHRHQSLLPRVFHELF